MKSNELRLGNILRATTIKPYQRYSVDLGMLRGILLGNKTFVGLELTEDILIESGGIIKEKNSIYRRYEFGDHLSIKTHGGLFFVIINSITIKRIEFLHQLQNIHFFITNSELKIKT